MSPEDYARGEAAWIAVDATLRQLGVTRLVVSRVGGQQYVQVVMAGSCGDGRGATLVEALQAACDDAARRRCAVCGEMGAVVTVQDGGPLHGQPVHTRCVSEDDLRPLLAASLRRIGGER